MRLLEQFEIFLRKDFACEEKHKKHKKHKKAPKARKRKKSTKKHKNATKQKHKTEMSEQKFKMCLKNS